MNLCSGEKQFRRSSGSSVYLRVFLRKMGFPHNSSMPRKHRISKCKYCRASKLSNKAFLTVLWCFVAGVPADQANVVFERHAKDVPVPSERTIRSYYKRIGMRLYERCVEPGFSQQPKLALTQKFAPEVYSKVMDQLMSGIHELLIKDDTPEHLTDFQKYLAHAAVTYRNLSAAKNGIRDSVKEHFALAFVRERMRSELNKIRPEVGLRNPATGLLVTPEQLKFNIDACTFRFIRKMLLEQPLE
jgi:hypothetical protein